MRTHLASAGWRLAAAAHQEGQIVICASHDPAVIGQADNVITLDA
jgi:ABC-type lipoprotein export system ATPase subunit